MPEIRLLEQHETDSRLQVTEWKRCQGLAGQRLTLLFAGKKVRVGLSG